ncbi:hypothetical protein NLI96_g12256 [Meripilus lineatus]|uniref:Reverse transcriptase Ty1/copia-type domain-containing protein n=1 Tax=Meripilus lineatus TaxID=2056292 RepID=A0AAD5UQC9_9APHY|nr:hypothetical protein NLI96_g12256 [Physisporinus lineatus]
MLRLSRDLMPQVDRGYSESLMVLLPMEHGSIVNFLQVPRPLDADGFLTSNILLMVPLTGTRPETFAPTVRMATIRVILALAALEDLELYSIDISQAFLNGELDVDIYMQQPEGFERGNPGDVVRLVKGLYGLKQAGRLWNQKLHSVLLQMGFKCLKSDASVYLFIRDDVRVILLIFIDNITLAGHS